MNIMEQKVVNIRVCMYGGFQTEVAPEVVKAVREPFRLCGIIVGQILIRCNQKENLAANKILRYDCTHISPVYTKIGFNRLFRSQCYC